MNMSDNSGFSVLQCVRKGRGLILRTMFGVNLVSLSDHTTEEICEGDIVCINTQDATTPDFKIYKKGSILNRYFIEFEKNGINPFFTKDIYREVKAITANPGVDDPLLTDYTTLPFVTIDNDDSKDLDQALYVEKTITGFIIYYAIADASYYVKPGTALFKESYRRGASYYLPGFSVPMLPRELSEGIISLNANDPRRALVFKIQINGEGDIIFSEVIRGKILSRAKLTYSGVQHFYNFMEDSPLNKMEYTSSLEALQDAGKILARNGERRGVVNFDRFENRISISEDGNSFVFSESERDDAGRWNEQLSLLCNMVGAAMLAPGVNGNDLHIHPVFKIHEPPDESSLHRLEKVIISIVQIHSLNESWIWRRGEETPGEYLSRLPRKGNDKRITEAIERQILITNQRSFFSENPGEHFALKVDLYGRFSSPMREIVGIYSQKELLEKLGIEKPYTDEDELLIREQIINSANRAKETQKTIDRFVSDLLLHSVFNKELDLEPDKRLTYTGTILGMKETRMYVLLDSPKVEIKVYSEDIEQAAGAKLEKYDNILEINSVNSGKMIFKVGAIIELKLYSFDSKGKWHFIPGGIVS